MKKSQKEKLLLKVEKRTLFGKKLKKSRQEGKIPANIFGSNYQTQAVFVNFKDFFSVYKKAKETGVVYLVLDKEEVPVLIQNPQFHPVSDQLLHVEFRKIDLTKTVQTMVPTKVIGISPAVQEKQGVLLTHLNELKVEAKPEQIPNIIEVDISILKEINQEIRVKDLPKSENYQIIDEPEKVIISVTVHKEEDITPQTTIQTPEIIEETKKPTEEESKKTKEEKETTTEGTNK